MTLPRQPYTAGTRRRVPCGRRGAGSAWPLMLAAQGPQRSPGSRPARRAVAAGDARAAWRPEGRPRTGAAARWCSRCCRAAPAQLVGQREQVLQRPHRAGQAGDDEHVALAQPVQGLVELGAGGELAGGGVGEDLVASVGGQVIDLAVVVLAAGGHPRVPDLRHHAAPARRAAGAYVRPGRGCPHRYPAAVTSRIAAMTLTVAQTASRT